MELCVALSLQLKRTACCNLRRRLQLPSFQWVQCLQSAKFTQASKLNVQMCTSKANPLHGDQAIVFNAFAAQENSGWGKSYIQTNQPLPFSDNHDVVLVPVCWKHLQSASSAALPALPSVAPSMLCAATETAVDRSRTPRLSRMRSGARCGNDVLSILQGPPNTPRSCLNSTSSTTRKQEKKAAVGIYVQQCNDFKPCPAGRGCYVMQSVPWD